MRRQSNASKDRAETARPARHISVVEDDPQSDQLSVLP